MTEHDSPDRAHIYVPGAGSSSAPPHEGSPLRMPRWVKGFAIAGAILGLLIVIMLLTGGHGPGGHTQGLGPNQVIGQPQPITVDQALHP